MRRWVDLGRFQGPCQKRLLGRRRLQAAAAAAAAWPAPHLPCLSLTPVVCLCCSLFQQAKERVLLRMQERRHTRVDPRRAFTRLQSRLADARLSLRALKNEQKQRLRAYYQTAVAGGSTSAGSGSLMAAAELQPLQSLAPAPRSAAATELAALAESRRAVEVLGTNGLLRVSREGGGCCGGLALPCCASARCLSASAPPVLTWRALCSSWRSPTNTPAACLPACSTWCWRVWAAPASSSCRQAPARRSRGKSTWLRRWRGRRDGGSSP